MEYVQLAPNLPPSSRLGFGCGSVMGRVGRAESLRAIAAALDAGITHFDVARLYGYGEAEAVLGEALRGRRDRVVIASKFGLAATRTASALRGLKPLAQSAIAAVPALRPLIRSLVGTARTPEPLTPAAARISLHESLRALKTDYLDILLLHEGQPADLGHEMLAFLEGELSAGTIRAYGAASSIDTVVQLSESGAADLLYQFANSAWLRNAERLPSSARRAIGHSPFLGSDRVLSLLDREAEQFCLPGGRKLEPRDVHPLMLAYALSSDRIGVVLCSMLDRKHLDANIRVAERPSFAVEEIAGFAAGIRTAAQNAGLENAS